MVLNNSTLLRVIYNKLSAIDVLLTFSPSNIPFIFLNEFNYGMFSLTCKANNNYRNNHVNSIKSTDQITERLLSNIPKTEHYELKYVSKINPTHQNYNIIFYCVYIFLLLYNLNLINYKLKVF